VGQFSAQINTIELQYASDIEYSPDGNLLALGGWESGILITRKDAAPHVE
jgi:hypothetical protein